MKTRIVFFLVFILIVVAMSQAQSVAPMLEGAKTMASGFAPLALAVGIFFARKVSY